MKKPHEMRLDELMSLPVFVVSDVFDHTQTFGGCFRDREGLLWGTCMLADGVHARFSGVWARFPAEQLARRSGLSRSLLNQRSSLRGYIDECDHERACGWAQDQAEPDAIVQIDLTVDGKTIARTWADQFREDLLQAGIGDGRHAFDLVLPVPLSPRTTHLVAAQRADDGTLLDMAVVASPTRSGRAGTISGHTDDDLDRPVNLDAFD